MCKHTLYSILLREWHKCKCCIHLTNVQQQNTFYDFMFSFSQFTYYKTYKEEYYLGKRFSTSKKKLC